MCELRMARIRMTVALAIALGAVAATADGVHSSANTGTVTASQPVPADTYWGSDALGSSSVSVAVTHA